MGKLSTNSILFVFILATFGVFANAKVTKLHFYIQDRLSGPDQTVWEVASAKITSNSPTQFGLVKVVDDLITAKSDVNSKKLGRLQGQITFADLQESAPLMSLNVVFQSGIYNGSSVWLLGRTGADKYSEYAIVGGTGIFRMARGYAVTSIYSTADIATGRIVLEYTLYVVHGLFGKLSNLSDM